MIGFLRFVGILNVGVWLGAAIFFTFGVGLAAFSPEMQNLLGANNYPCYSGAIAQVFATRYFHFQKICAAVAVVHLLAEWLYLGKRPRKFQSGLLLGLCAAVLLGAGWLQPKLKALHAAQYSTQARPETRATASRSFKAWQGVSQGVNVLVIAGLGVYLWRAANPSDPTRFVSAMKFALR